MCEYEEITTLLGHTRCVNTVCFSPTIRDRPNDNILISGSNDNTIRIWDMCKYQKITILNSHTKHVDSICVSPEQYDLLW